MQIWLRRYTFNSINEYYKKEKEDYEEAVGKGKMITGNTPIAKPNISQLADSTPTYTSKISRK